MIAEHRLKALAKLQADPLNLNFCTPIPSSATYRLLPSGEKTKS